jgi:uncharacterized protein (DUF433 family)
MLEFPAAVDVPLKMEKDGAIRVGGTRVLLEVVIGAHQQGDTPEQIVQGFDVLKLEDVYAVIAYYLHHRDDVDEYIRQVDAAGEELRRKFEALPSYKPLTREMLLARMEKKRDKLE